MSALSEMPVHDSCYRGRVRVTKEVADETSACTTLSFNCDFDERTAFEVEQKGLV